MTEATGERIRPPKAAYKETPYESPARLGNGTGVESSFYDKPSVGHPGSPEFRQANPLIKGIEESAPDASTALIDAVRKVYAAVTQKIAYHESEARKLRESLAPFASIAPQRQSDAAVPMTAEARIKELLDLADKLQPNGEQTP